MVKGRKKYFDHKPHLTVITFETTSNLRVIKKLFNEFDLKKETIKIKSISIDFFDNDPITNLDTLIIRVDKSKKLVNLQSQLFDNIISKISLKNSRNNIFSSVLLNKNLKNFGFPFFGKIWLPHFTIGSFKKDKNKNLRFKTLKSTNIQIKKISLNKIFNNGNYETLLSKNC